MPASLSAAAGESSLSAADAINIKVTPAALWGRQRHTKSGKNNSQVGEIHLAAPPTPAN